MRANFSSASPRSFSRLADCAAPSSSSDSPSSSSICASSSSGDSAFFGSKSSLAFGSIRPSTTSSTRDSSFSTLSASSRISRTVVGQVVVDLRVGEEAALLAELDQVLEARAAGLGVLFRHLGRDQPFVLAAAAAAAAALALRLDLVDLRFQQLERLLGALDRRFCLGALVVGFRGERLYRERRPRRSRLVRPCGQPGAQPLLDGARLRRRNALQRPQDLLGFFLGRAAFPHPGLALLVDHPYSANTTKTLDGSRVLPFQPCFLGPPG